jgi:hypothetical protein
MKKGLILLLSILTLGFAVISCDDDDSSNTNNTNNTNNANIFNTTIIIRIDSTDIPVNLADIQKTTFDGTPAIRLTRIIEQATLALPWSYHYDFIANDDYSVLVNKYEGDLSKIPVYGELENGFIYDNGDSLKIGWDPSMNFASALNVKHMDGGVIELHKISRNHIVIIAGELRELVDLSTLNTMEYLDYGHVEDGTIMVVPMTDVLADASGLIPSDYDYRAYAEDGFSNNADNLIPYINMTHAYFNPAEKRLLFEEAWDTSECCWSTKDTVVLFGFPTN